MKMNEYYLTRSNTNLRESKAAELLDEFARTFDGCVASEAIIDDIIVYLSDKLGDIIQDNPKLKLVTVSKYYALEKNFVYISIAGDVRITGHIIRHLPDDFHLHFPVQSFEEWKEQCRRRGYDL